MPHYRALMEPTQYYDRPKLASYNHEDATGKTQDITYKILAVRGGEVQDQTGRKTKKPILMLLDRSKKEWAFPVGATVCKTLEKLYGANTDGWVDKLITLYVTTTHCPEGEVYCLRPRPQVPQANKSRTEARPNELTEPPAAKRQREPGEEG